MSFTEEVIINSEGSFLIKKEVVRFASTNDLLTEIRSIETMSTPLFALSPQGGMLKYERRSGNDVFFYFEMSKIHRCRFTNSMPYRFKTKEKAEKWLNDKEHEDDAVRQEGRLS